MKSPRKLEKKALGSKFHSQSTKCSGDSTNKMPHLFLWLPTTIDNSSSTVVHNHVHQNVIE